MEKSVQTSTKNKDMNSHMTIPTFRDNGSLGGENRVLSESNPETLSQRRMRTIEAIHDYDISFKSVWSSNYQNQEVPTFLERNRSQSRVSQSVLPVIAS
jgi:hypothetical protein